MTSGVTDTPRSGGPQAAGELAWHTLGADQVLRSEGVDGQRGLNSAEAAARTQEAAVMILTDDNFSTIVKAVELGRGLYDNLARYIRFQIGGLFGYIATFLGASIFNIAEGIRLRILHPAGPVHRPGHLPDRPEDRQARHPAVADLYRRGPADRGGHGDPQSGPAAADGRDGCPARRRPPDRSNHP
jgi:hypothetical protein